MAILVNCPACRHVRQVPDHEVCLGVMCPYCHGAYMDAVDRPLGGYAQGFRPSLSSSSYEVDVGQWFAYATAHWSSLVWPAIAFFILQLLVVAAIETLGLIVAFTPLFIGGPLLAWLVLLVVLPAFEGGWINVCLAQLKGDRWRFADFFSGFSRRWLWKLVAFNLLMSALFALILTPVWAFWTVGFWLGNTDVSFIGLTLLAVFGPLTLYVGIRIAFFGPYLIIDRDFGPVEAIQESWDLTTGHFWGLLGVSALLYVILVAGNLALYVGLLFALPLTGLVRAAGYLLAGGTRPPIKQPEIN